MYVRILNGFLTDEFMAGVEQFVEFCQSMPYFESEIRKYGVHARTHLYSCGFVPNYQQWVC